MLGRAAGLLLIALLLVAGREARAQAAPSASRSGVALSVEASTMGPSIGVHVQATETVRVRLRGAYLPYTVDENLEGEDVDPENVDPRLRGEAQVGGPEVRLDWHPFDSGFHLSGGLLYNLAEADAVIAPTSSFEFTDTKTFGPERIGELSAEVSYSTLSPYAGLGFGDAIGGRWGVVVELGAYYVGAPTFDFEGEKLIEPTERNQETFEEGFESFRLYPHFALGLSYQF